MLVGHEAQISQFLDALAGGRMHHAWLLAGPKGVGKRAFADAAALRLLAGDGARGDDGFSVDPMHPLASLLRAGTHPDHRVLMPPEEGKGSTQKIIPIQQVRDLREMLQGHPALGDWRTVIVDSIDDMERPTANAFLKSLEEPGIRTVMFLVSHAPGRLLPTIRSRCRVVRFDRLSDSDLRTVLLQAMPEAEPATLEALAAVAEGAPGEALRYAGLDLNGLAAAIDAVMRGGDAVTFARGFQAIGSVARFEALMALGPRRVAEAARSDPSVAMIGLYERANALCSGAVKLAYDRVQVAFDLATVLAQAGRLSGK